MHKGFASIIIVAFGLFLGVYVMLNALGASTSGISTIIKWLGIALAIIAFLKPKTGLYIIVVEAFFTDYLKKLAVYYGSVSYATIIEVMAVVVGATCFCFAGRIMQVISSKKQNFTTSEITAYAFFAIYSLLIFYNGLNSGALEAAQRAFNGGVYLGVSGLCVGLLKTQEDVWRLVKVVVVCGLLWAVVCLKQYIFGFSNIEHFYAETGLSPTASNQMLLARFGGEDSARPFGLGSGLANYTSMALVFLFAAILTFRAKKIPPKIIYFIASLLIFLSCIASQGKTTIAFAIFVPPIAYLILRLHIGKVTLIASIAALTSVIVFSDDIRYSLEIINNRFIAFFHLDDSWSIRTFAPRLDAFTELKNPNNWEMIGGEGIIGHSQAVETLSKLGVLPVILLLMIGLAVTFSVQHYLAKSIKRDSIQGPLIFVSCAIMSLLIMLTGNGMFAQPTALVIGIGIGVFLSLDQIKRNSLSNSWAHKKVRSDDSPTIVSNMGGLPSPSSR